MAGPDRRRVGRAVGTKFDATGVALPFAGNTIISLIDPSSSVADVLRGVVHTLGDTVADDFKLLPESSWHMTVFELVCDQVRTPEHWSTLLSTDVPLEATDQLFADRFATVEAPQTFDMRPTRLYVTAGGIDIGVEPLDEPTTSSLRNYRTRIAEATGVRFPDHDTYRFHLTLAYTILEPSIDDRFALDAAIDEVNRSLVGTTFHLQGPVLTFFADMTEFSTEHRPTSS